jgi:hypothetical protein
MPCPRIYIPIMRIALLFLLFFSTFHSRGQVPGCTDKSAVNFNPRATVNNGSCNYSPVIATPVLKFLQPPILEENSGMIFWNNMLWQHNDSGGEAAIYAMDTMGRRIFNRVILNGASNTDWEDMTQDETHIYIGDFGNNANGARKDLKIYKILKNDIGDTTTFNMIIQPEIISFRYEDQPLMQVAVPPNTTDFDCEAMISYHEKLYLFTKQWKGKGTVVYELDKTAGDQVAIKKDSLNVGGLISGADINITTGRIVLTGYSLVSGRFLYLLYDFPEMNFFRGNKRKISLNGPYQTESVSFKDEWNIYLGSESFSSMKQRLEILNLEDFFK